MTYTILAADDETELLDIMMPVSAEKDTASASQNYCLYAPSHKNECGYIRVSD